MEIAKRLNTGSLFLFLFFVVFPFGQIIRQSFNFFGLEIPLQPVDIIVGLGVLYTVILGFKKPQLFRHFDNFLIIAAFSFLYSIFLFKETSVIYGLFYLIRLGAYLYFLIYILNFLKEAKSNYRLLLDSLLGVSFASAVFGWVQYFQFPDIKPFFVWGWDIHLYRLVGTFLDPAFLSIILVFGIIIALYYYFDTKKISFFALIIFLLVSLAFTYSRAGYLALLASMLAVAVFERKIKQALLLIFGLIILVSILPTTAGKSAELLRSFSVLSRIGNYKETLTVFRTSPVIGIGFDEMCLARQKYIDIETFASHSCSGSDSSLLLILATTGLVGLFSFIYLIGKVINSLSASFYSKIFLTSGIALAVDSLFSNSFFYPWVMGWMIILLGLSLPSSWSKS